MQGFVIPALATNRVESEMDLTDGQSFAIAGLLDNRVTEQMEKIPGIGDIPILGKLFQSRSVNKSKNELLIVVTPQIVQPLDSDTGRSGYAEEISRPLADGDRPPKFAETVSIDGVEGSFAKKDQGTRKDGSC